jgi:hypothetical protein
MCDTRRSRTRNGSSSVRRRVPRPLFKSGQAGAVLRGIATATATPQTTLEDGSEVLSLRCSLGNSASAAASVHSQDATRTGKTHLRRQLAVGRVRGWARRRPHVPAQLGGSHRRLSVAIGRDDAALESSRPKPVREHPGGTPVTTPAAGAILDADTDRRWHEWRERGAAADRRTAARMRVLMLIVVVALVLWFAVQLT